MIPLPPISHNLQNIIRIMMARDLTSIAFFALSLAAESMGSGSIENRTTSILFPKKTFLQIAVFILLLDLKPYLPPFLKLKGVTRLTNSDCFDMAAVECAPLFHPTFYPVLRVMSHASYLLAVSLAFCIISLWLFFSC